MLRTHTYTATAVTGTTSALRDELIECQHPTEDFASVVHMDGDYVFDASIDDSISSETRQVLKELVMFTFTP